MKTENYYIFTQDFVHENVTYHKGYVIHAKPVGNGMVRIFGKHAHKVPEKYVRPLEPADARTEAAWRGAYDTLSNLREFGIELDWGLAETIAKFIEAAFVHIDGGDTAEFLKCLEKSQAKEN